MMMRRNLLNWCNLVSISKKLMFYILGVVRIVLLQKIMMKDSKIKFSENLQNISRTKSFGKFVFIVLANSDLNLWAINDCLQIKPY